MYVGHMLLLILYMRIATRLCKNEKLELTQANDSLVVGALGSCLE